MVLHAGVLPRRLRRYQAHARAEQIMGSNFIGVEEGLEISPFPIRPSVSFRLGRIPFSEGALEMHRETHILVAVLPVAVPSFLLVADERVSGLLSRTRRAQGLWLDTPPPPGWHLVRKLPVKDSGGLNAREQRVLLKEGETVPDVEVAFYTALAAATFLGERIFVDGLLNRVRCASIPYESRRFGRTEITYDDAHTLGWDRVHETLGVGVFYKRTRRWWTGIASELKPEQLPRHW
ncbi:MAG: hypothetical protein WDZ44_01210 [Candidatus Spechtbacterales bacterium]